VTGGYVMSLQCDVTIRSRIGGHARVDRVDSAYPRVPAAVRLQILPGNELQQRSAVPVMDKEAKRVLIVDDDTLQRGLCALALRPAGYDLHEAECGEGAVESFIVSPIDLVILDVQMDGIDGYETCRRIRRLPGGASVPIIMLTGFDDADSIERAYEAGATDFMPKPFHWSLLAQRARYALRAAGATEVSRQVASGLAREREVAQLTLETDLRRALRGADEMLMYLQPKVDIRTGMVCGAEALIRWQHPVHGLVSPAEFIPVAEKAGLAGQITEWMLEQACRQMAGWRSSGLEPVPVSVNISAFLFTNRSLVEHIDSLLRRYQLAPGMLVLEVTESVLVRDMDNCIERMRELRKRGIGISLDDFGTGYSSLSYLKVMPLDELKLDRSFVTDVGNSGRDQALAASVVQLAQRLDLNVVAEGVETEMQAALLAEMGCHIHQGYLYGRPAPAAGFSGYLMAAEFTATARMA
jgi:EAL domain-containing protein (putative c-di-GMP-specific phosphodiesterase class I)/DNA-binding NarL/FixJ family response regulator